MHERFTKRFWAKVDVQGPDDCWPWTASRFSSGYGTFWLGDRHATASRVSWEIANDRPLPPGLFALHSCDNPPCVNPAHLWAGTKSENTLDAFAKGRLPHASLRSWPKDTCRKGHPMVADNLRYEATGRRCLTCYRATIARRDERNRQRKLETA